MIRFKVVALREEATCQCGKKNTRQEQKSEIQHGGRHAIVCPNGFCCCLAVYCRYLLGLAGLCSGQNQCVDEAGVVGENP